MKRVVAISDLHCGHAVGLAPPEWWFARGKAREVQKEMWGFFKETLAELQPIHALLVVGDAIDGKGQRSGSVEQITTDHKEQCDMAAFCIQQAKARKVVMCHGTKYHVGADGEDFERHIAEKVGAKSIGGHEWADANGLIFDLKHKVGSSSIPYGRHTAVAKERLWNVLWNARELAPKSDIILRAHVHHFNYCGGADWLGMTMPALQGPGSKYGIRECSGTVHFGMVSFNVYSGKEYTWQPHLLTFKAVRPVPVKL